MAFLRSENKRLAAQNLMLSSALDRALKDAEKERDRFVQACMECELRRSNESV